MAVFFEFASVGIKNFIGMKKRVEVWLMSTEYFLVD
jgi:hypothetical protein